VHLQLVVVAVRDQRGERDGAAHPPVEAGAGPDAAPRVPGDQLLEVGGDGVGAGDRGVDVLRPEHLAAHGEAVGVQVEGGLLHGHVPHRSRREGERAVSSTTLPTRRSRAPVPSVG
jgi:hypothetical protein